MTTSEKNDTAQTPAANSDSLGIPMKKSPILIYALLQIPLLLIMVVILYFMYRAKNPN